MPCVNVSSILRYSELYVSRPHTYIIQSAQDEKDLSPLHFNKESACGVKHLIVNTIDRSFLYHKMTQLLVSFYVNKTFEKFFQTDIKGDRYNFFNYFK